MRKKSTILLGLLAAAILLSVSGCARETRLVQITIEPSSFTFLTRDTTLQVHFTALGRYIIRRKRETLHLRSPGKRTFPR